MVYICVSEIGHHWFIQWLVACFRCQTIIWTNDGLLSIGTQGTNFSGILIAIHTFSFKKIHLKMLSVKWQPFSLGLIVFKVWWYRSCGNTKPLTWYSTEMANVEHRSRDHSGYGLSQWEKALHSNASSHWLNPYPEWSLSSDTKFAKTPHTSPSWG